jgi:hypothetical protein
VTSPQQPPEPVGATPGQSHEQLRHLAAEVRTPLAAGVAGIVFALILGVVVVLLHLAVPVDAVGSDWITESSRRSQLSWALQLVPYAGIAFLWFIGVIRTRLGDREDRLVATVFLGSGLLFIAMLFAAAASMGALLILYDNSDQVNADVVRLVSATSAQLLATYGIRMAAIFTMVVTNLGRRTEIVPGWLQLIGYAVALVLLFVPPRTIWATLLFPAWVLIVSVLFLLSSARHDAASPAAEPQQPPEL